MNISYKICSNLNMDAALITRDRISLRIRHTIWEPIEFLYLNITRTLTVIEDQLEDE